MEGYSDYIHTTVISTTEDLLNVSANICSSSWISPLAIVPKLPAPCSSRPVWAAAIEFRLYTAWSAAEGNRLVAWLVVTGPV